MDFCWFRIDSSLVVCSEKSEYFWSSKNGVFYITIVFWEQEIFIKVFFFFTYKLTEQKIMWLKLWFSRRIVTVDQFFWKTTKIICQPSNLNSWNLAQNKMVFFSRFRDFKNSSIVSIKTLFIHNFGSGKNVKSWQIV